MSALFDPGPADENTLTDRQRVALLTLRNQHDGLQAEDIGMAAHVHRGAHADRLCAWCAHEGRQILHALERKGLANQRKGRWYATTTAEWAQDDGRYDPATSEWPDGF